MISIDFLLDVYNMLTNGASLVQNICDKLKLLATCAGIKNVDESIQNNHGRIIERAGVSILAILIGPEDMNQATCLFCGNCPKVVNR